MADLIPRNANDCLCTLYGTIAAIDIDAGTADVTLDIGGTLSGVEVFYHCQNRRRDKGITAFNVDDEVKLVSVNNGNGYTILNTYIVGFKGGNRGKCSLPKAIVKIMFGGYAFLWDLSIDDYYPDGIQNISSEDSIDAIISSQIFDSNIETVTNDFLFWFYAHYNEIHNGVTLESTFIQASECPEYTASSRCAVCEHEWKGNKWGQGFRTVLNTDLFPSDVIVSGLYEVWDEYGTAYSSNCPEECSGKPIDPDPYYKETYHEFWTPVGNITAFLSSNLERGDIRDFEIKYATTTCGGYSGPGIEGEVAYYFCREYCFDSAYDDNVFGGSYSRYNYPYSLIIESDVFVNIFFDHGNSYFLYETSGTYPPTSTLIDRVPRQAPAIILNYGSINNGDSPWKWENGLPVKNLTQAVKGLIEYAYAQVATDEYSLYFGSASDISMEILKDIRL